MFRRITQQYRTDSLFVISMLSAEAPFSTSSSSSYRPVILQTCCCPQCACPLPPAPRVDAACSARRCSARGRRFHLARLHPRATVRSLNGKAQSLSGVIWTVRFWEYLVSVAAPNFNFSKVQNSPEHKFLHIM